MQTISRASSRRSQADSAQSKQAERGQSSGSDSENEDNRTRTSDLDNIAIDISDEKAWDTDLEQDGELLSDVVFKEQDGELLYDDVVLKSDIIIGLP